MDKVTLAGSAPKAIHQDEDMRYEIHREAVPAIGGEYRIVFTPSTAGGGDMPEHPFALEFRSQNEDGTFTDDFGQVGGSPGLPGGEYRTLKAATLTLENVKVLGYVEAVGDDLEKLLWEALEVWDGR